MFGSCSSLSLYSHHQLLPNRLSPITASELQGEYARAITLNHMDAVSLHTDTIHSSTNVKSPFPNLIILLKDQPHNVHIAHALLYIPKNINRGVPDPCEEAAILESELEGPRAKLLQLIVILCDR